MKFYTYEVSGRGSFPIDMLRYAEAFPASEVDSGKIEAEGTRTVRVRGLAKPETVGARWSSFCWQITAKL